MSQGAITTPGLVQTRKLLAAAIATGAGTAQGNVSGMKSYQADGTTSAGAGDATIVIQGSHDGTNWNTIGTISLTLATTTSSDSFASDDRYRLVRANVTAISGTDATVSVAMGY